MVEFNEWRHVFKLDPNKSMNDEQLEAICQSGTDAIIVGGSDGVTFDNTIELLGRIRRFTVPCVLEVSVIEAVSPGFDYYFIPTVLNSDNPAWFKGLHHQAIKEYGELLNWDEIMMEGYCILNEQSKVARLTNAKANLSEEDVIAYAKMAEKMFRLPIFYLEYSGAYGNPSLVEKVAAEFENTRLFYGGGIDSPAKAAEMANYANTIVVGNVIYENLKQALKTVTAVK
ncbi:heptaprenylglyceryl phosphate synthase [Pueribacillus theae]|uniref:Heptaprenylglyceryl phosphate synthase n=1 Tax=Pueribacillus theae TaxID=2171751 RepID=A0A2U1JYM9_9BACI|nr:heptaprenylglyceryl phosphate synthase [Pueribacillus theae]PWA10331.1 heptaprenylglyceryl phosphate synthase [Pueribacillus theae]